MRFLIKIFFSANLLLLVHAKVRSQGCVAIRSTGGISSLRPSQNPDSGSWLINVNNRYFKSYKHFRGKHEETERVENGTEVINHTYSLDLFVMKNFGKRWAIAMNIPMINNARSSLYEHGGNNAGPDARHSTHSFGLGDIRVAAYAWIIEPSKMKRWNMQLGLGVKLPTGDYRYQDYFIKNDSTKILGPVDQSIQLGDGGTGITAEMNTFYSIDRHITIYANAYYLANPREQNGVSTARGSATSAAAIANGSDVMSVPDQYMLRGGVNFGVNNFIASAGVRYECIPVYDLIGGSNGFRRPGYVLAIEPGITYQTKKFSAYVLVPVALERNRTQSVPDKIRSENTGVYVIGDAAFADYSVNAGVAFRF
ncbi:transporter [Pollutibacter soli]|uniref:transporter n=1 Tax=Pollutibacter soli TaxID=3034157 RepID=UPI003013B4A2